MKKKIKLKKSLGQHFLIDEEICKNIFQEIKSINLNNNIILEIGPGDGALTKYLYTLNHKNLYLIEIDSDMIQILKKKFSKIESNIIKADFLKYDLNKQFENKQINIVGNFPYNISTQIFHKIIENRDKVENVVCMLQKEVAERIVSGPGSKKYGIPSVLIQAFFDVKYLFEVAPDAFNPPPKVTSAVIALKRNKEKDISCDYEKFRKIVKLAFNQRRKTLKNALKPILVENIKYHFLDKRAEELSPKQFEKLTISIQENLL